MEKKNNPNAITDINLTPLESGHPTGSESENGYPYSEKGVRKGKNISDLRAG